MGSIELIRKVYGELLLVPCVGLEHVLQLLRGSEFLFLKSASPELLPLAGAFGELRELLRDHLEDGHLVDSFRRVAARRARDLVGAELCEWHACWKRQSVVAIVDPMEQPVWDEFWFESARVDNEVMDAMVICDRATAVPRIDESVFAELVDAVSNAVAAVAFEYGVKLSWRQASLLTVLYRRGMTVSEVMATWSSEAGREKFWFSDIRTLQRELECLLWVHTRKGIAGFVRQEQERWVALVPHEVLSAKVLFESLA